MFGYYQSLPPSFRLDKKSSSSVLNNKTSPSTARPSRPSTAVTAEVVAPSIDGPPSPERIRAYTEQMKMNPIFINTYRDYDRSASASVKSGESGESAEGAKLSRNSSQKSKSSSKTSKGDRPESVIGKMFSRSKKPKVREPLSFRSTSSLSNHPESVEDSTWRTDRVFGGSRRGTLSDATSSTDDVRKQISGPYNFQHVTHTRQDHLPNLERTSRLDLVSEFSAMRAAQVPTQGQLKGIRTNDLHFENFSSEAINETPGIQMTRPRSNSRNTLKKAPSAQRMRPRLSHAQSHESLRGGPPPPRPPRSPLESTAPSIIPPPRTSSRTASMLWDNYDPLATTSLTRPSPNTHFRTSQAFHLPISPPRPMVRSEQASDFVIPESVPAPHASPSEAWPLPSPFQLADVKEEDEEAHIARRRSRMSRDNVRHSRSVPDFQYRPETPQTASTLRQDVDGNDIGVAVSPSRKPIKLTHEAWEDDIDYCYEHEAEADCDYNWDRCSLDEQFMVSAQQPDQRHSRSSLTVAGVPRQFRESFLVPSALDLPELSPMSPNPASGAPSPDPRTPSLLRPSHLRSPSHASSFKESHGFTLSPSLLIPTDFAHQMQAHDEVYSSFHEHDGLDLVQPGPFNNDPISPIDEARSSTASYTPSYRSSAFSRNSHSTAASTSNGMSMSGSVGALKKSGSQESVVLLSRAASVARAHRSASISSAKEMGILVAARGSKPDLSINVDETKDTKKAGIEALVSPVGEMTMTFEKKGKNATEGKHGRKTSAPLLNGASEGKRESKGRKRSSSAANALGGGKTRSSYMLFPQS